MLFLADAHKATKAALGPNGGTEVPAKVIKEREPEKGEEVWNTTDLRRSSKRGACALELVNALLESILLTVPTTVAHKQQLIEDAVRLCADFPKLDSSLKTKKAFLVVAQKDLQNKYADFEERLPKLRNKVNDSQTEVFKAKEVSVFNAYIPEETKELIENALAASRKLKYGAVAVVNAESTVSDLQIKPGDSDKQSERLTLELLDEQKSLAGYVEVINKEASTADSAKSKLKKDLSSFVLKLVLINMN